ncbi:MAG: hypothetical protein WDO16_20285 [Bacteroidota bacterium]
MATSLGTMPTEEITRVVAPAGTVSEKEPSDFVVVPVDVPFTITDAFGPDFLCHQSPSGD